MSARSTQERYGFVAVTIHWLSALLILVLIGSGFSAGGAEDVAAKSATLRLHIPLGIAVLLLTVGRIAWWGFADTKPRPTPMPGWQDRISRAIHVLFYIVILGMAASGIGMIALSGAAPIIFSGDAAALPYFRDYLPRTPHGIGARAIVALFVLHAGAALYHHFVRKDGLLGRMWYST